MSLFGNPSFIRTHHSSPGYYCCSELGEFHYNQAFGLSPHPPFPSHFLGPRFTYHEPPHPISWDPQKPPVGLCRRRSPHQPFAQPSFPIPCLTSQPWYLGITASQSLTALGYTGNFYPDRPEKAFRPPTHPPAQASQLRRGRPSPH